MISLLVNIDVPDLDAAVDFYRRAVGLQLGRRLFDGAVAEMLGASAPIYLLAKPTGSTASATTAAQRDYRRHWTPVHFDVTVADISAAVRAAQAAGARLEEAIVSDVWGSMARMSDPFGHGFCFIQFSARGYDEVTDG